MHQQHQTGTPNTLAENDLRQRKGKPWLVSLASRVTFLLFCLGLPKIKRFASFEAHLLPLFLSVVCEFINMGPLGF